MKRNGWRSNPDLEAAAEDLDVAAEQKSSGSSPLSEMPRRRPREDGGYRMILSYDAPIAGTASHCVSSAGSVKAR
jgi:hypothetical protein